MGWFIKNPMLLSTNNDCTKFGLMRCLVLNSEQKLERSIATGDAMKYKSWYSKELTKNKPFQKLCIKIPAPESFILH